MREANIRRLNSVVIKKKSPDFLVMHFLIRDIQKMISGYATGAVLDVGCGNKPYETFFGKISKSYTGCDVVQSSDNKVDVLCEATNLDFKDTTFDTVFTTQVMEHVSNSDLMLQEINRVLKPGGITIISVPFCWELHEEPYDYFRFSKYGLTELCRRNNFEVLEILPNGGKWATVFQININMIYSVFKKKHFFVRCLKFIFINLQFTRFLNWLALKIDNRFFDPLLTLNYVVVAKKLVK